ncbi:MAG: DDE-type integrase/transposase/recombinase [Flavobacteriales bacterium]|jgi:putative transposase|nr:DDE-type integrase/transposase/recombinase [Flavobacteriales bacterium]
MEDRIYIEPGYKVLYNNKKAIITRIIDIEKVMIEEVESGTIQTVPINDLSTHTKSKKTPFQRDALTEKEWNTAQERYQIIKPIIEDRSNTNLIEEITQKHKVSQSTIYRWIKSFDTTGLVSSLANKRRTGGKNKSRLMEAQEDIILNKINSVYLNKSRKSITKTIREIQLTCNELGIKSPHPNTIRNRIKSLSNELTLRKRFGHQEAKFKYEPIRGSFPGADYPLSVVQIDHTPVDIILVDHESRKPLSRPWLTLAIDVYSRVVLGIHLSFETPGALGTGICIANAILPKEKWLEDKGIESDWPCWGIMKKIHVDNAKEFKGIMLKDACVDYGIELEFRPIGSPNYGGHVERLLGTFAKEIHNLPGTTFSSSAERGRYNSKQNASFTLKEFEKWLVTYITKVYHNKIHSTIKTTPINKYRKGLLGSEDQKGTGLPFRLNNERKVKIDFLPVVQRSVQEYGVLIDHIYYYADVLRHFIHDTNQNGQKVKHKFKRDPRDISLIYFFDPNSKTYYEIPYRDTSLPSISIWEYRNIVSKLKGNQIEVNENAIFEAYRELNSIEEKAIRETKHNNKTIEKTIENIDSKDPVDDIESSEDTEPDITITPFEDIDDEAYN